MVKTNHKLFTLASLVIFIVMAVALSGCCSMLISPTPTPTPSPTITPTPTPVPTPTPTPAPRSLGTGTYIVNKMTGGEGSLTIDNLMDHDAVVTMASESDPKNAILSVYVKGGDIYLVTGIRDGRYVLYDMLGNDWDSDKKQFTETNEYAQFNDTLIFVTGDSSATTYTLTLRPVISSNPNTHYVSPSDMPAL